MKKKIGFIDLFIDEWHANNYPAWIRGSKFAQDFELYMAWEEKSKPGLRPLEKWCSDFNMIPASSQDELIEKCDCLLVLAPSNPEVHEKLAEKALKSGKRLYMDKPFAPDRAAAERIFAMAARYNTPMFSSSALRYSDELLEAVKLFKDEKIEMVGTTGGGGSYWEYCIHQLEMVTALMGTGAKRLMQTSSGVNKHVVIEYGDERVAHITYAPNLPFQFVAAGGKNCAAYHDCNNTFQRLLDTILDFFNGAPVPVPHAETVEIAAMVGRSIAAQDKPNVWFDL